MGWLVFAYSLASVPLAFWWCCCNPPSGCLKACRVAPTQMQVTITGVSDNICTNCSPLNSTYTLTKHDTIGDYLGGAGFTGTSADAPNGYGCEWTYSVAVGGGGVYPVDPIDLCPAVNLPDSFQIVVRQYDDSVGPYRLWARIKDDIVHSGSGATQWWYVVFSTNKLTRPNCSTYSSETPAETASNNVNGSCTGGAITITALP